MSEQSVGYDVQPVDEQFQISPLLEKIRLQTGGTPESVKTYFQTLSFDGFSELLNELNSYFRRIPGEHTMDGTGFMTDGYMPPDPNDRVPLLKEAFEKAIKEDVPEKCAMILGMSILTIHPYLEANGRTSRTIFALLINGYSGSMEDKTLFAAIGDQDEDEYHRSGSHIIDLDPNNSKLKDDLSLADLIFNDMRNTAISNRFGANHPVLPIRVGFAQFDRNYNSESKLSREEQFELGSMFRSNNLAFVACINSFSDELYEKSLKHINFEGKEYDVIAYKNIIKDITSDDLSSLRSAFRQARIDYVRKLMDVTCRDDFQDIYQYYDSRLEEWKKQNQLV